MSKGQPKNVRVSLSRSQLQEGIGAELFSLCQGMTADRKLSKAEILTLGQWLQDNKDAPLPGIALLSAALSKIVADGRVTFDEQRELLEAFEKVLPPEYRKEAKASRKEVEAKQKAELKASQQAERQQGLERQLRRSPEDEFDFMVAGVHADDRYRIIERSLSVGDRVRLRPDPENPHDEYAGAVTLADWRLIGYVPPNDSIY